MSDFGFGGATRIAADDASPYKTQVNASGSTNTKGSWTQVAASVPFDIAGIVLSGQCSTGGRSALIDIGVGAAAAEVVVLSNLLASFSRGYDLNYSTYLPLSVKVGARLSLRLQSNVSAADFYLRLHFVAAGSVAPTSYPVATTYGADTATSDGTSITSGGSAGVKGSYAQLSASVTYDTKWLLVCIGPTLGGVADFSLDIAVGAAAAEVVVVPDLFVNQASSGGSATPCYYLLPVAIKAGSRLSARAASTTSAIAIKTLVIGFS
jgi:hypothetical protein